jgi:uncharacterized membrane protein YphA (DoxX/SURF4 family)
MISSTSLSRIARLPRPVHVPEAFLRAGRQRVDEREHLTRHGSLVNIALWILQGLLALVFLAAGAMKTASPRAKLISNPQMAWASDFTPGQIKLIGLAEVAGAVGLIAPWATRIAPQLTPVAAACLGVIMFGAARVHSVRKEPTVPPLVLAVLCGIVVIGRLL